MIRQQGEGKTIVGAFLEMTINGQPSTTLKLRKNKDKEKKKGK